MRIFLNARFLSQKVTGVQQYSTQISRQFLRMHAPIRFLSPSKIIHLDLAKKMQAMQIGKFGGHFWEQVEIVRFLKKQGNPLFINLANTAPLAYKNNIITIHDLSFLRNPQWFSKSFYIYYRFLIPKIAKDSIKIFTPSAFSKKEIIELLKIPAEKIEIAPNAVPEEVIKFRNEIFPNVYGDYILAVGSLNPRKNLDRLILAFNKIKIKNLKLIITGDREKGFANVKITQLIKDRADILFTGYVDIKGLVGFYKNARAFVFPSLYEGFGLPPLEAMACGCPVVASNVASIPEVCQDAAYYVDSDNIESIAKGIYEVLTKKELREKLRQKGLERAKAFCWEISAQKYLRAIEEVINKY